MGMELVAATQPGFSKAAEGILGAPWRCTHDAAPGTHGVPGSANNFSPSLLFLLTATFRCQEQAQATDWRSTLQASRKGVHKIDKCLNAVLTSWEERTGSASVNAVLDLSLSHVVMKNHPHRRDVALHRLVFI